MIIPAEEAIQNTKKFKDNIKNTDTYKRYAEGVSKAIEKASINGDSMIKLTEIMLEGNLTSVSVPTKIRDLLYSELQNLGYRVNGNFVSWS